RLRSAIRRIVEDIWCVFVSRGRERIALVQAFFKGVGWKREFTINWIPAQGPDRITSLVFTSTSGPSDRGMYLKDRAEAQKAVESLEETGLAIEVEPEDAEGLQQVLAGGGIYVDPSNRLQIWAIYGTPINTQQTDKVLV